MRIVYGLLGEGRGAERVLARATECAEPCLLSPPGDEADQTGRRRRCQALRAGPGRQRRGKNTDRCGLRLRRQDLTTLEIEALEGRAKCSSMKP